MSHFPELILVVKGGEKMKGKNTIKLPKELQGEIIVVAYCCCRNSTKHAGGHKC